MFGAFGNIPTLTQVQQHLQHSVLSAKPPLTTERVQMVLGTALH